MEISQPRGTINMIIMMFGQTEKKKKKNCPTEIFSFCVRDNLPKKKKKNICDGSMQDCSISIANALEILQSCTKPSIYSLILYHGVYRWVISTNCLHISTNKHQHNYFSHQRKSHNFSHQRNILQQVLTLSESSELRLLHSSRLDSRVRWRLLMSSRSCLSCLRYFLKSAKWLVSI